MIITDMQKKRRYHNLQFTPMKYYQFRNDTCGRIVLQVRICVIFNLRLWQITTYMSGATIIIKFASYHPLEVIFILMSPSGGNTHLNGHLWR